VCYGIGMLLKDKGVSNPAHFMRHPWGFPVGCW
jgi:hypothetical protein